MSLPSPSIDAESNDKLKFVGQTLERSVGEDESSHFDDSIRRGDWSGIRQLAYLCAVEQQSFEPAAYNKTNCVECHGKEAQKKFEPALPESQLTDAILNGATMETPPDMPGFAEKGINEERAKALLAYMKSIRE